MKAMTYLLAVGAGSLAAACAGETSEGEPQTTTTSDSSTSTGDTCELPLADVADRCDLSYDEARTSACAWADGLEFMARYGACGDYLVVWEGGFYSEQWCVYAASTGELVGVRFSDDIPASCGAHTVEAGDVSFGCAEPPTPCPAG